MEAIPELRMETEDRQSTEYEVHHQKLVNIHHLPSHASLRSDLIFPRGCVSNLSSLVKIPWLSPWRWVSAETTSIMCHAVLCTSQRNICAPCIWGGRGEGGALCMYTHTQIFVPTQFCIQSLISFRIVMPPAEMPQSSLVHVQIPNPSTLFSPKALIS